MRILKYELIKIFRKKFIIIALIIFSLVNIYKINFYFKNDHIVNNEYKTDIEYNAGYWAAHNKISGTITNDKINFIKDRYKHAKSVVDSGNYDTETIQPDTYTGYIFGDMNMFKELYDGLDYCYNYGNRLKNVILKAQKNIEFYREHNNLFQVKNNEKIINVYGERGISEFYDTKAFEEFFRYDFSSLLIILLLILGLTSVFSGEKESSMNVMLLTSKYGRNTTIYAKIIASMIYVITISIYFFILDFICFSNIFKLIGHNLPIYAMVNFERTPLNMKIWHFVIYSGAIKLLGFMVIGVVVLLFSSIFSESILAFILSGGMISAYLGSNDFLSHKAREVVDFINPISLLTNREFFKKYNVIDIFGEPFFQSTVTLIFMLIFLLLIIFIIVIINRKNISISKMRLFSYLNNLRKEQLNI
ncbi:hypothetical protein RBU49_14575 [Clostridium sp. MB40-C1]|uniref:hypothetical protein n=1 Tax=Clostridium sp. MB40-C1 TaxID=3070996 RepID=UPI0027DEF911|nr:hypothetical protein [Clostridium sp. MB40-C1]WMJ80049.1 hypothetical protein RBU49_14575 [Clostridium sp. MB40-C1]